MENKNTNNNSLNLVIMMGAILMVALVIGIINVRNLNSDIDKLSERVVKLENIINGTGSESQSGYDTSSFKEIKFTEVVEESKKETIVVWLGVPTCGYCQAYAPLIADVAKDFGITARYVDVSKMDQEDYDALVALEGEGDWAGYGATFTGTPFTVIVKKGKVVGGINGYVEAQSIETAFKAAGLKK